MLIINCNIAFKIRILGALSVGDGQKGLSPPCCLPKIIILKAIEEKHCRKIAKGPINGSFNRLSDIDGTAQFIDKSMPIRVLRKLTCRSWPLMVFEGELDENCLVHVRFIDPQKVRGNIRENCTIDVEWISYNIRIGLKNHQPLTALKSSTTPFCIDMNCPNPFVLRS